MLQFVQKCINLLVMSASSCGAKAIGDIPPTPSGNSSFGRAWGRKALHPIAHMAYNCTLHQQHEIRQDPYPIPHRGDANPQ